MSVTVIRVVAEQADGLVEVAYQALRRARPDIGLNSNADLTFTTRQGECGVLRFDDLRLLLAESALWVDVRGVPIEPPLVIVRAVDCLLFQREVAR